jgi:hypothetical protein
LLEQHTKKKQKVSPKPNSKTSNAVAEETVSLNSEENEISTQF